MVSTLGYTNLKLPQLRRKTQYVNTDQQNFPNSGFHEDPDTLIGITN